MEDFREYVSMLSGEQVLTLGKTIDAKLEKEKTELERLVGKYIGPTIDTIDTTEQLETQTAIVKELGDKLAILTDALCKHTDKMVQEARELLKYTRIH